MQTLTKPAVECPFVDRSFVPDSDFNEVIEYECEDGSAYVFYYHHDGDGVYYNCQFCKLIGRKRDVFECLNESEWKQCRYYRSKTQGDDE